jgi:hypothetical protein
LLACRDPAGTGLTAEVTVIVGGVLVLGFGCDVAFFLLVVFELWLNLGLGMVMERVHWIRGEISQREEGSVKVSNSEESESARSGYLKGFLQQVLI